MLKHENIIENLTKEQKIALLTDNRDGYGSALEEYNIPTTSLSELWAENAREDGEHLFPSAKSLANSWDERLFGNVAKCLASLGASRGDNLFILPSASAASSYYGAQLSEEPHLSGALVAAMATKMKEARIPYCLREPVCSMDDARFLDKEASAEVLYDRYTRPFKQVYAVGGAYALVGDGQELEGSYKEVNERLRGEFVPQNVDKFVEIKDGDSTTAAVVEGKHLIGGSSLVLSTALENYNRIYRSMEEGGATAHELNMTLADGAAISEEMLDKALDNKLELAYKCSQDFEAVSDSTIENIAYEAAKRSIVMVKNANRALPLSGGEKICVVGDIIFDGENSCYKGFINKLARGLSVQGKSIESFEKGYNLNEDVSKPLIEPACTKASQATTTIAFVGLGKARENALEQKPRLALPGNQIALLTQLRKVAKKLIVVVCGESLPDMSFDILADAILLAPPQGAYVGKAVCDILNGDFSPCGKLAYAGYSNVDTNIRELQKRKNIGKQKIGPFVGYRYADSNGEWTRYPMGFGLSYTGFEYSKMAVDRQGNVTFTVRNIGRVEGSEAVQVYVAMPESHKIRPRKELKGFLQVSLKPGERKDVVVPLGSFDIYDEERKKTVIEAGNYDIHVASHANQVHISRRINLIGATLNKEDKRLSDYLQNVSNIVSESYTMEAYCKPMNTKSKLRSFGFILLLTTLFADVVYFISGSMNWIPLTDSLYLSICIGINAGCLLLSFLSILIGSLKIAKAKRIVEKQEYEATKELFKTVKPADVTAIDQLFEDEFDMSLEASHKKEVVLDERDDSTYTYMAVDTDIPTLCKELIEHFAEYGLEITPKMSRKLLSSILTSRLLIVRNEFGASCEKIVEILARFFGTTPHTEKLDGVRWDRKSMLRYNDQLTLDKGSFVAPLMQAINSAAAEGNKACFYGVENVVLEDLGEMLMPYVQYFGNPEIEHKIVDETETVTMPSNMWFVVSPAIGQSLDDLPAFVANLATVIDLEADIIEESPTKAVRKSINCYQMEALVFRAKKAADIDENVWKGVDTLEAFVADKTPYHIGNKLFLQLEKYMAIYTTCDDDLNEALDCAVAGKLIPGVLNLLKGNEGMEDVSLTQIMESIFGEEYSSNCCTMIKRLVYGKEALKLTEQVVEPSEGMEEVTAAEPFAQPVAESVAEPFAQPVAEPVAEPFAQPVAEPFAQPVAEPVAEPFAQPVAEPVAEPFAQPVAEPVAEPFAQPVAEPVAEPFAQPVAEPVAEPFAQPVAEPVAEPFAQPTAEPFADQRAQGDNNNAI